ncbi:MAG TPA: nuclear transport factor 2 family protein [Solirubrobacterales bacterium]
MTWEDVDRWLADYVEAWEAYDRDLIEALFAEDVSYRYHPADEPIEGRDAVVESWLGEGDHPDASDRDDPGTYEASYRAFAVDGDAAVATGTSSYREEPGGPVARVYDNCFLMRFDSEGRCREFTEFFMQRKSG